jgi:hypothetical protein
VVAIPGSAFRVRPEPGGPAWLRFAFCRGDATVAAGARRIARVDPAAVAAAAPDVSTPLARPRPRRRPRG